MDDKPKQDRPSSAAAEQIEDLARRKLAAYPDLANTALDFGAMPDGTIDIWVNEVQYNDVKDTTDARVQIAIEEAVAEFNRT